MGFKFNPFTGNLDLSASVPPETVVSPGGTSTDNAVARFDGTSGTVIQNSLVIVDDSGNLNTPGTVTASNVSGTNTGDVTLGTPNGLSLTGQQLSLALSSASTTGALDSTDWNTFNNKQPAGSYANTSLNNLASVAINASLVPGARNTVDVGSNSLPIRQLFMDSSLISSTTFTFTADSDGSNNLTNLSVPNYVTVGWRITGPNVPTNTMAFFGTTGTQITLLNMDTGSAANIPTATGNTYTAISSINIASDQKTSTNDSGHAFLGSGWIVDGKSGNANIFTGGATGTGNSGNIILNTGSVTTGTQGNIVLAAPNINAFGLINATNGINAQSQPITNVQDPASAQDASTKNYTDTQDALKLSLSGGTMSGAINLGSNKITNLAAGSNPSDAVNYNQLTSLSTGLLWQGPINDPDLVNDSLSTPPVSPVYSLTYIIASGGTGAWTGLDGHAVWWDGANWIDLSTGNTATSGQGTAIQVGDRFLIASASAGGPANVGGSFSSSNVGQIVTVTGNTPGSFTYSFTTPLNNWAVSDQDIGSQHFNNSFTYVTDGPYTFTVSSANATVGATYTNNGHTFTVTSTIVSGTSLLVTGTGAPTASGTLTLATGSGDATITFSSYIGSNWINFAGPSKNVAGNALSYNGNTLNVLFDNSTINLNGSNQLEVKANGITSTQLASSSVTNAKLANMAAHTYKGNNTGSSSAPLDVTNTQLTADLNQFTSSLQGVVPGSGGGTTNFLRADGTWAPTNPGTVTSVSVVSANGLAGTVSNPTSTPAITLSTTVTGLLKGNGTAISAATSGTDYAPATSGSSILYGNGSGGFNNATVGAGLTFTGGTLSSGSAGDITETSFTAADNQATPANVTGLAFANATVRSFEAIVSIVRGTTYAQYTLNGVQAAASWYLNQRFVGDTTGLTFTITNAGQIQYTSTSTGSTALLKFRALTTSV